MAGECGEWVVRQGGWFVRQARRATDGTYDQRDQGQDSGKVDVVAHPRPRPFHRHPQRPQPLRHERRARAAGEVYRREHDDDRAVRGENGATRLFYER